MEDRSGISGCICSFHSPPAGEKKKKKPGWPKRNLFRFPRRKTDLSQFQREEPPLAGQMLAKQRGRAPNNPTARQVGKKKPTACVFTWWAEDYFLFRAPPPPNAIGLPPPPHGAEPKGIGAKGLAGTRDLIVLGGAKGRFEKRARVAGRTRMGMARPEQSRPTISNSGIQRPHLRGRKRWFIKKTRFRNGRRFRGGVRPVDSANGPHKLVPETHE